MRKRLSLGARAVLRALEDYRREHPPLHIARSRKATKKRS
jgi:hypothetical protein